MNVTIKDIARKLNLNHSSISRALNDKPGVSEKTRRLVQATAKEMEYHPNELARGLVKNVTRTIGAVIPEIINPLYAGITTGIFETAAENDYKVLLCITNWNPEKETEYLRTFKENRVDGIIIKATDDSVKKHLANCNVPIVGYESWNLEKRFSSVGTDNYKGGYLAARHLLECGYENIAFLSGPQSSHARSDRLEGFLKAYSEKNIEYDSSLIFTGEYNIDSGYASSRDIFSRHTHCDAVFAGNDVMALGVLQYLEEHGIRPGVDIGVMGFDDIRYSMLPQIQLTTVTQPISSIGRIITSVLLKEISNIEKKIETIPQQILLEPELIPRSTTCRKTNK